MFPFLLVSGLVGLILGPIIKKRKSNKLYSIILLPLLLNPMEALVPDKLEQFTISSEIFIETETEGVWSYLIEVPEIEESEYKKGFFNYIGVPRPVKSELKIINGKEYRVGYFSDELVLFETITKIEPNEYVEFDININESKLRDLPTDNHLLKSNYFHFDKISYRLEEITGTKTQLFLDCQYSINSNMNTYANFWAKRIIKDFEIRLLDALKLKVEGQS